MKDIIDFLNESKGQRISMRKSNKPYDANDDKLVHNKETRNDRADGLKIQKVFNKFVENIKSIYDNCDKFGLDGKPVIDIKFDDRKATNEELLKINEKQYQLLGISFADHPIVKIKSKFKDMKIHTLKQIDNDDKNSFFRTICMIVGIREITDSKGKKMAFIKIEDETKLSNGVIFGTVYSKISSQLKNKEVVALSLRKDFKKEGNLIILNAHKINTI